MASYMYVHVYIMNIVSHYYMYIFTYMYIHVYMYCIYMYMHVDCSSVLCCRSSLRNHLPARLPSLCHHSTVPHQTAGQISHNIFIQSYALSRVCSVVGSNPTRGSSFFLGKVTTFAVLLCFALFV